MLQNLVDELKTLGVNTEQEVHESMRSSYGSHYLTMQVISAIAEFEKDQLIERAHAGIARAKASGKRFGRPAALNDE